MLVALAACGRLGFGDVESSGDGGTNVDMGVCMAMLPCEVIAQTGCCGGDQCHLDIVTARHSCEPPGIARENDHCMDANDCEPGTGCAEDKNYLACHRFCANDADCTNGPGSRCAYSAGASMMRMCSQGCDPIVDIGCASDGGCRIFASTVGFITECQFAGTRTQGQFCTAEGECDGGYSCVANTCRKICRVGVDSDCPNQFTCGPNDPPAFIAGTQYGTCD